MNITENCIDRHLKEKGEQTAIIWEPNDPNEEALHISYSELSQRVNKFSNALKLNGIKKGDRVCIYMPMIPELAVAVLACARIGAVHSVVFAGFSARSLMDRINDASCKIHDEVPGHSHNPALRKDDRKEPLYLSRDEKMENPLSWIEKVHFYYKKFRN